MCACVRAHVRCRTAQLHAARKLLAPSMSFTERQVFAETASGARRDVSALSGEEKRGPDVRERDAPTFG